MDERGRNLLLDMRNRHAHGYGGLNLEIIHSTALRVLPELIAQLDTVLGDT
jgi:uncharacterized protein with HEPN domain